MSVAVWAATTWGSWQRVNRLIPDESTETDGSMGRASFKMLRQQRNDGYRDIDDSFAPALGMYLIISNSVADPIGGRQWAGRITAIHEQPMRGEGDSVGSVEAVELGSVLEQTPVAHLKQRDPAGGASIELLTNPPANYAGSDGQVIGNCYTGETPPVFESLPSSIGASGTKWSRYGLLSHVLTYAPEGTELPDLTLSVAGDVYTYLATAVAEVIELDTLNLKSFLDVLVGPASGFTWKVIPHADNWTITIDSAADAVVGTFPAGSAVNVTLDGDDTDLSYDTAGYDQPDAVEVVGAPIVYCGTVSPIDGTLGAGWSASQEAAYIAAGSAGGGYGALGTDAKIQLNRGIRKSALLSDTYVRYELKVNAPSTDLQCSDNGVDPASGSPQPLCPSVVWDGVSSTNVGVDSATPYLPTARILRFLPIPLNDTTAASSALAAPKYMEPMVFRLVDTGAAYDAWPGLVDMLHPPSKRWDTPNVSVDDRGPAIRIEYDHPEMLARADWTSAAVTEQDPTLTTSYGATDWRGLILTVAIEGDQRVKASVGSATPVNVLRIYRKDLHCWLVRAGTLTGCLDASGFYPGYSVDTFTRDDHPVAQRLANEAAAFALRARTSATISTIGPDAPPVWASVGTLIGDIDDNGEVRTSNTVVRSVRRVWDPRKPRLIVTTDYPSLPTGGMGGDVTRVSLGGSVAGSLHRSQADLGSVARDIQGRKIASGAPGQREALAKTFSITQTAHGFAVGDWIGNNGVAPWVKADRTGTYEKLAMVLTVVDANQVDVAYGPGLVYAPTLTYTDFAPYYLATAGAPTGPLSPDDAGKTGPVVERLLFWAIEDHWLCLAGPYLRDAHNHHLGDGADVKITTPANGDILQYVSASQLWKNVTVLVSLGSRAAISVIGRAANSVGVAADIAASTTGDVLYMGATALQWGPLQTASYDNLSVTTAKLSAIISAGSAGTSSSIPVITWGVDGRLTTVTSAAIAAASMATLTDATITSPADLDFVRYDSGTSKWKNTNLGRMTWTAASSEFALDGGSGASASSVVGIGKTGSRFMLGTTTTSLDFYLSGSVPGGTDKSARIRAVSSAKVSFYDDGGPTYTTGTEVLRWNCSTSAGSRSFDFLIPVTSVNIGLVARMRKTSSQSLSAATDTTITGYATLGSATLTGLDTTTGVFTAPAAGTYMACASIYGSIASSAQPRVTAYISKNASTTDTSGKSLSATDAGDPFGGNGIAHVTGVFEMAAGDTLRLVGHILSGTTPSVDEAYFSVARII